MAVILVFNNNTGELERYERSVNEPMPYNVGGTLTVGEFLDGESLGYTDTATMQAWNLLRGEFGVPIRVDEAFVRISGNKRATHNQHYAGTAFRMGSNLSSEQRSQLRTIAENCFAFVQPDTASSTVLAADRRYLPAEYFVTYGFPLLYNGSKGNYVALAQDALNALGYSAGSTDGIFGRNTEAAARAFENARRVSEDGFISKLDWESLINMNVATAA